VSPRLPEAGSFENLLRPARIAVASLVRLSRHPATEPYWSAGVYRFDDPDPGSTDAFGTCYTASSIEIAFAERLNVGFAFAIFGRSGLRKLRAEKLGARQVDELCDRFNVTAV
jgi:hypothetical protein